MTLWSKLKLKRTIVAQREPRGDVTAGVNTHVDRKEIQKKKLGELLILHTQNHSSNPQSIAWSPSGVDMIKGHDDETIEVHNDIGIIQQDTQAAAGWRMISTPIIL